MIQDEVNSFMALAPLMAPSLIKTPNNDDSEISKEYGLLYFPLDEKLPIGMVADMCVDNMELLHLFFASSKASLGVKHCCMFTRPSNSKLMYKINLVSDSLGFISGLTVTIFDSPEIFEQALEKDLMAHSTSFTFEHALTNGDVLSLFCKIK